MPKLFVLAKMEFLIFELLHDRINDHIAIACAFDLLMLNGEDLRRKPFAERKAALRKLLRRSRHGIQYVEHTEGDGEEMFQAACKLGLEGIVSKRIDAPYRPGSLLAQDQKSKAPAATRASDGTF
jgi:ATP-dependent DNA ligase